MIDDFDEGLKRSDRDVDMAIDKTVKWLSGSQVDVTLKSTPIHLGSQTIGDDGQFRMIVSLPPDVELGYHTIHVTGTDFLGQKLDLYRPILIYESEDDKDGDGVKDDHDPCLFVEPAGIDKDQDGIDDAYDGFIGPTPVITTSNSARSSTELYSSGPSRQYYSGDRQSHDTVSKQQNPVNASSNNDEARVDASNESSQQSYVSLPSSRNEDTRHREERKYTVWLVVSGAVAALLIAVWLSRTRKKSKRVVS